MGLSRETSHDLVNFELEWARMQRKESHLKLGHASLGETQGIELRRAIVNDLAKMSPLQIEVLRQKQKEILGSGEQDA